MSQQRIAVIAGDGIGTEVMPEGLRCMEAAASRFNLNLQFDHFDFSSCDYFERHGKMLPDNWKDELAKLLADKADAEETQQPPVDEVDDDDIPPRQLGFWE